VVAVTKSVTDAVSDPNRNVESNAKSITEPNIDADADTFTQSDTVNITKCDAEPVAYSDLHNDCFPNWIWYADTDTQPDTIAESDHHTNANADANCYS
jgi:hypothetical protein